MSDKGVPELLGELIAQAATEDQHSLLIILTAYLGAHLVGDDMLLADAVAKFAREVLLPRAKNMAEKRDIAKKN